MSSYRPTLLLAASLTGLLLAPITAGRGLFSDNIAEARIAESPIAESPIAESRTAESRTAESRTAQAPITESRTLKPLLGLGYSSPRPMADGQCGTEGVPCSAFKTVVEDPLREILLRRRLAIAISSTGESLEIAQADSETQPKKRGSKRDLLWLLLLGLGTIAGAAIFAGIFYVLTNSGDSNPEPEPEPEPERTIENEPQAFLATESPSATLNGLEPNPGQKELPPESPENLSQPAAIPRPEINAYPEARVKEYSDLESEIPRDSSDPLPMPNKSAAVEQATEDITRIPHKIDIVEELLADLRSTDPTKRRRAIWELGQRGDSRAVQPLVDLMLESDSKQRSLILAALSEIGTRTLKPINRALSISLQDNNPDVRKNAIRDLTRIYEMLDRLSQLLRHAVEDSDPEVRETAHWAMDMLDRIRTIPRAENRPALPNWLSSEQDSPEDIP